MNSEQDVAKYNSNEHPDINRSGNQDPQKYVDINCDMGEGAGNDNLIMPFISSVNIACGYHAGDAETIVETLLLAAKHGVAIGAHPSFPDRENFGRKEMQFPREIIYDMVSAQIEFIMEIANTAGLKLHHVKPHGALYNMAAADAQLAGIIAQAVKDLDDSLVLFGLSGSHLIKEAVAIGLKTGSEVFADRTYSEDGALTSRAEENALIENVDQAVKQALQMIMEGTVTTTTGHKIPIIAETICIHGDGVHAHEFAKSVYQSLKQHGIEIKSI